jgi:hypothetical protein
MIAKMIVFLLFFVQSFALLAGEGMWLPLLLKSLNENEMQSMGMKMSVEDIYSVNQSSLKDAIVSFGGRCTSELISSEGLLLTNHHCGYRNIVSHSTVTDNKLKHGYWAMDRSQELPNPNLYALFIERIEDVTTQVLEDIAGRHSMEEQQVIIDQNIRNIVASTKKESHEDVMIRSFFNGNQYFLFVTVKYPDVRLVGTPPESIGKFGADTDNWMWPRHTGDFSVFRIYAGKDNLPAPYSEQNVPYKPKHYLPVSLDGVEPGDFTLVYGFPGTTNYYLSSAAIQQIRDVLDPAKVGIRDIALEILDKHMRIDENIRLMYASKFASTSNSWKRWQGEMLGLKSKQVIRKKQKMEAEFSERVMKKKKLSKPYGHLLPELGRLYREIEPYAKARDYYQEIFGRHIELFKLIPNFDRMVRVYENNGPEELSKMIERSSKSLGNFYKNYNPDIDEEVCRALIYHMRSSLDPRFLPEMITNEGMFMRGQKPDSFVSTLYKNSIIPDHERVKKEFQGDTKLFVEKIRKDPAYAFYKDMQTSMHEKINQPYEALNQQITALQKEYMRALIQVFPEKRFWPDANRTMRVSYGKVTGYQPRDGVIYETNTYLEGVIEKYKPGDYEFDVDEKLISLYESKDFGPYGENGKMPVCFIGTNHTTGGSSGSAVIDAHGNLIGLNFDRAWEGTMSDIYFDPDICRNIAVDIRYVLFIMDKYAGASHLIEEMTLVHPKKE